MRNLFLKIVIFVVLVSLLVITTSCAYLISELFKKPSGNRIIPITIFLQYAPEVPSDVSEKIDYTQLITATLDSFVFKINDQNFEPGIRDNSIIDLKEFSYDGYNKSYSGPVIQNISVDATITYSYTLEETGESSSMTIRVSGSKTFTEDLSEVTIVLNGQTGEVWIGKNDDLILVNGTVNEWKKEEESILKVLPSEAFEPKIKNLIFTNTTDDENGIFKFYVKREEQNLFVRIGNRTDRPLDPQNPTLTF